MEPEFALDRRFGRRAGDAAILVLFAIVFSSLGVWIYRGESATFDEPLNVAAGYAALTQHDYRLDPQHPPFLRAWAALPLLGMHAIRFDRESPYWSSQGQWRFAKDFLYQPAAGDPALGRARFMVVLLGVVLGILLFQWTRQRFGRGAAIAALALYTTEPNLLAHATLATTDLGIALFFAATLYFLWRTARAGTRGNLAGLVASFALASVTKHSSVLLIPTSAALLAARALARAPWSWRLAGPRELTTRGRKLVVAALVFATMLAVAYGTIWAVYGFRWQPTANTPSVFRFAEDPDVRARAPALAAAVGWIDHHHLLPNAFAEGFLLKISETGEQAAYLAGRYADRGWWYFFPIAFLVKTPVALIVCSLAALLVAVRRRARSALDDLFVWLPVALYFAVAMRSGADIGVRYLLPVYPLVIVGAGGAFRALLETGRGRAVAIAAGVVLIQAAEFASSAPHELAFFNAVAGGPRNGYHWLVDSSLDWGQDLKSLARWMREHHVPDINLSYFGTAEPSYYGMACHYLPGAPQFEDHRVERPSLPGYVAVSVTNLQGVYLHDHRGFYQPLAAMQPVAVIGYSIRVYRVDRPWW